jgi:hypothetical protein
VTDADAIFARSKRPLIIGVGGGGDVVGALATAETMRLYYGARPVVGGVAWERRVIDPTPGPRRVEEISGATPIAPCVLLATEDAQIKANQVRFAEAHMARYLQDNTVLLDILSGPQALAESLEVAADYLDADMMAFIDVGGDSLAHGDEPRLASPLCDALLLATAACVSRRGRYPVLGGIFGAGCDGELSIDELLARMSEVAAAGGLAGARGLTQPVVKRLEGAVRYVPTEASAQALRCFRGEHGTTTIRAGQRSVPLSPVGAMTIYFDVEAAVASAARLASVVAEATSLEQANELLHHLGIGTELDLETEGSDR